MENQQDQELTQEELAERKEQMLSFYTESMPYLEAQAVYEKKLCEIDELKDFLNSEIIQVFLFYFI